MSISYLSLKHERQWRATTGLKATQFHRLCERFGQSFKDIFGEELAERQGNSSQEPIFRTYEEVLFFLLFGFKSGLTYDVLGLVFGMDGSSAKRIQETHMPVLKSALHQLGAMPKRSFEDVKEFKAFFESDE